jgi:hypothetical protein
MYDNRSLLDKKKTAYAPANTRDDEDAVSSQSGGSRESVIAQNSYQDRAFSFLDLYRLRFHKIPYIIYTLLFTIQTLPLLAPEDLPYGGTFHLGFSILNYVNHFGFIHIPYDAAAFISIGFLILYALVIILFGFSYYCYSRGSALFDKVKIAAHTLAFILTLLSFPLLQLFSRFWQCNYQTNFLQEAAIGCWTTPNIIWGVIGLINSIAQIVIHSFAVFCLTDMSLGPKCSILTIDSSFYMMYEHTSYLILQMLSRIAFVVIPFMRPIMGIAQALVTLLVMFGHLPFYYAHVNAIVAGFASFRLVASLGGFIVGVGNVSNNDIFGIAIASIQIALSVVALGAGIILHEVFMRFIRKIAIGYGEILNNTTFDAKSIRVRILEMAFRISLTNQKDRPILEKIVKQAGLESIESTQLLLTQAVLHIFFSSSMLSYASLCLQKSTSYRPSIFTRLTIYQRFQDLEIATSQSNDKKRIYQIIQQGKNFQAEVHHYRRAFWKGLVSDSVNLDMLSNLSHLAYLSETECDRIYSGLINNYPKSVNVNRVYASYLEEVKSRADDALFYYTEAEALEEQEQDRLRQKRRAFSDNEYGTLEPATPSPRNSEKALSASGGYKKNSVSPSPFIEEYDQALSVGSRSKKERRPRQNDDISLSNRIQLGEEVLSSADLSTSSSVRKQQLYLKQLNNKDHKCILQLIILSSVSIFLMAYVFTAHGLYDTKMDYLGIDKLKNACRMQIIVQK